MIDAPVSLWSLMLLALALSMDATAVAAARGLAAPSIRALDAFKVALFFGGAQALMPLFGAVLGRTIGPFVEAWDHWIAFVLLAAIGGKMIIEAIRGHGEEDEAPVDPFGLRVLSILAIATSIDAFAAGISLTMIGAPLVLALPIIGVTTAVLSVLGLYAGRRFGRSFGPRLEIFGGVVLIALGVKILIEHLQPFD